MNHVSNNYVLGISVYLTSVVLSLLFFIPFIGVELGTYQFVFGWFIWVFIYVTINNLLTKQINKYINKQIDNENLRCKYVNEFIQFMENDNDFSRNILRKDVPIIENGKEIGTQTIYSAFKSMFYKRFGRY